MSLNGSRFAVQSALTISMLFHGVWNCSEAGALWWGQHPVFVESFRWLVGGIEIVGALLLWVPRARPWVGALFFVLMLGAIREHWSHGFSFKENGYEAPLVYALLSLGLALEGFVLNQPQVFAKFVKGQNRNPIGN